MASPNLPAARIITKIIKLHKIILDRISNFKVSHNYIKGGN